MEISVGLITSASPVFHQLSEDEKRHYASKFPILNLDDGHDLWLVENLLIGKQFHWQKEQAAVFKGRMETDPASGTLINKLPLDDYLYSVVGSEMNPKAPLEFLRAHAIVSRSWAVGKILKSHPSDDSGKIHTDDLIIDWQDTADHEGYDVCSDDHCQRYQGVQPISEKGLEAIKSTDSLVLVGPSGTIVDARFSKCCGGHTELFSSCWQNEERECLESFDDPWCNYSSLTEKERRSLLNLTLKEYDRPTGTGFEWTARITANEIRENLISKFGRDIGEIISLQPLQTGASGRIVKLRLIGSEGNIVIGKELAIRRLLSASHLYSSAFTISQDADTFTLQGRGWGHGVGMCQTGAARMAAEGRSAQEILAFYYPGSRIVNLAELNNNDKS